MITGKTKLLGVIGDPVAHSLSPVMHNAAIQAIARADPDNPPDYAYLPFPVNPGQLKDAIAGFAAIGVEGFNVTIPHKQAIMSLLSEITPLARAVGAVNTVYRTATGWGGTNTDVAGFVAPLREISQDWQQATAVVLGNGGAARAVVAGCAELGFAQIRVVGRSAEKLAAFQHCWAESPSQPPLITHSWTELPELLPQAHLLVNTTPIGMHPQEEASPLELEGLALLPEGAIAYDLIYTPRPTRFLHLAQAEGAIAIDGLEMLVQQGAAALELWLQRPVPIDVMRQTLLDHLRSKI
jgi:shikimate dehydrogenase